MFVHRLIIPLFLQCWFVLANHVTEKPDSNSTKNNELPLPTSPSPPTASSPEPKIQQPQPKMFLAFPNPHIPTPTTVNCLQSCPKHTFGTCIIPIQASTPYFYRCIEGEAMVVSCFPGMVYSLQFQKCVPQPLTTSSSSAPLTPTPSSKILPLAPAPPVLPPPLLPVPPALPPPLSTILGPFSMGHVLFEMNSQLGNFFQLLNILLKKSDLLEKKINKQEIEMKKMSLITLQTIKQASLICQMRVEDQNDPKLPVAPITNDDHHLQEIMDQKMFEAFDKEESQSQPSENVASSSTTTEQPNEKILNNQNPIESISDDDIMTDEMMDDDFNAKEEMEEFEKLISSANLNEDDDLTMAESKDEDNFDSKIEFDEEQNKNFREDKKLEQSKQKTVQESSKSTPNPQQSKTNKTKGQNDNNPVKKRILKKPHSRLNEQKNPSGKRRKPGAGRKMSNYKHRKITKNISSTDKPQLTIE